MTTINDDLIKRSADIRWPVGFDPVHADLFAHNAVVINAPAKSIWTTLIAAAAWPKWYTNASDVVIDDPSGQLGEDVTFSWTTFGLKITSKVAEFAQYARLGWYGNGDQLRAYHTWLLVPRLGDSTYVVMEEIGMGDGAQHLDPGNDVRVTRTAGRPNPVPGKQPCAGSMYRAPRSRQGRRGTSGTSETLFLSTL